MRASLLALLLVALAATPSLAERVGGAVGRGATCAEAEREAAQSALLAHRARTRTGSLVVTPEDLDWAVARVEVVDRVTQPGGCVIRADVTLAAMPPLAAVPPLGRAADAPGGHAQAVRAGAARTTATVGILVVPVQFDQLTGNWWPWPGGAWGEALGGRFRRPGSAIALAAGDRGDRELVGGGRLFTDPRQLDALAARHGARGAAFAAVSSLVWPPYPGDEVELVVALSVQGHVTADRRVVVVGADVGRAIDDMGAISVRLLEGLAAGGGEVPTPATP